jgi:DNA-directed RNA polymerase specialized sigma24 family protein
MPQGSVTQWVSALREYDEEAARQLWERFFARLVGLTRQRIAGARPAAYDAEDVALSAFDVFCRCVQEGRYPQLQNRDELWRILATITLRKARDRLKAERRQKRGGPPSNEPVESPRLEECDADLIPSPELGPEFEALMADECRLLLELLGDAQLEQVVLWKLDGYTAQEIADKLGRTRWSVSRMMNCVRDTWQSYLEQEEHTREAAP